MPLANRKLGQARTPEERRKDLTTAPASGLYRKVQARPIVEHPHATLSQPSIEVDPEDAYTVEIANQLLATMRVSPGCVGLAAPQIGENLRIFSLNVTGHKKARSCAGLVVVCNPRILARAGNVVMREGCASVPHLTGDVARASEVLVAGTIPGSTKEIFIEADAIEARCILHEIDHLDGMLFIDRVLDPTCELFPRRRYC
jgi:peptide deformylase